MSLREMSNAILDADFGSVGMTVLQWAFYGAATRGILLLLARSKPPSSTP
jgi:hypothetical protein